MKTPPDASKRAVLTLAWPIGVSMISFTLKGAVDTFMVGQLGLEALAGVGFAGVIAWTITAFAFGALRGQRPLVTQHLGAGQEDEARGFGAHAFYLALIISALLFSLAGTLGALTERFSQSGNMSPHAASLASAYLDLRLVWSGPMLLALAVAEYQRSLGQTRTPMIADLIAHPLNALFNYLLIFGHWGLPELGVRGAAIGTGLADTCSLLILLWLSWPRGERRARWLASGALHFSLERLKRVWSVGYTGGLQFSLESVSFVCVTYFISHLGDASIAVQQASIQLIHLVILPALAIADGGSVLVGQYVGEGDWASARRAVRSVLGLVLPFMLSMALIFIMWGGDLIGLFIQDPDVEARREALRVGERVVWAIAAWQLGDAFQVTYRNCLRAAGDHKWVMWLGISMSWLVSVPIIGVVIFYLGGDLSDAWLAHGIEIYLGAFIFYRRWQSGRWMNHRLVD